MVDPDNRRPVDFAARQRLLADIAGKSAADLLGTWQDGAVKLCITAKLLALRRAQPDLFKQGDYRVLAASGRDSARICAFSRHYGDDIIAVAVSLFPARAITGPGWAGTTLALPAAGAWASLFDGREFDGAIAASDLFRELPVAVLTGVVGAG
jgi:(1->4)-alpha-D-glucan 1-alpha-D-glucosylmutase